MKNTVSLLDFADAADTSPERDTNTFARAMEYCKAHDCTTLIVPPGKYVITSQLARDTQKKVMEGEYGSNPQGIMFNPKFKYTRGVSFAGQHGTTLIGDGAVLMVDGFMEPVSVRECSDITIQGITIDHVRKPYTKGTVTKAEPAADGKYSVTVKLSDSITPGTPIKMRYVLYSKTKDLYFIPPQSNAEFIDGHTLKLTMDTDRTEDGESYIGMEYYTLHSFHSRPAILIEYAENTTLKNVTINSQPGMGIVGNRSNNILISGLSVVPSEGDHFSTNTDATHFTSITGLLRLENSEFVGQGDDFVNVHNYYHTITPIDKNTCYMHTDAVDGTHAQSLDYPDVGDKLELTERETLEAAKVYTVTECTPLPEENRALVKLDGELPDDCAKYVLADITRLPRLEVVGCRARNHFARSILIKTRSVLIENNRIDDAFGPGIVVAAESWWSEGVCPADVTIRGNVINNSRNMWGEAGGIVVKADCQNPEKCTIYNVTIENNTINCPKANYGIYTRNTDGLVIRNNRINAINGRYLQIIKCMNVQMGNNQEL